MTHAPCLQIASEADLDDRVRGHPSGGRAAHRRVHEYADLALDFLRLDICFVGDQSP
jgi:hypothetical protein